MHLIFGSSSGIGLALAEELLARGESVEVFSHRPETLEKRFESDQATISHFDGLDNSQLNKILEKAFAQNRKIDSVYIVFGTGHINPDTDPVLEIETIQLNALAFTAAASHAYRFFAKQGYGKLIGISSVAAVRGSRHAPAYNASKALVASYLEGLRGRAAATKSPILVCEIRPGFIDTAMMKAEKPFWLISAPVAVKALLSAVERGKSIAYIPRRWQLIAAVLRLLPSSLYHKL